MAFKYRSSYRSKFNRILSKGRIFSRKSKRAQASQIWALKKKLSTYIRRTRPETLIQQMESTKVLIGQTPLNGGDIGLVNWIYPAGQGTAPWIDPQLVSPTVGSVPAIKNDFVRLYNCLIEGVFRYEDPNVNTQPVTLRLVAIQTKTTRAQDIGINDVFKRSNTASDSDNEAGYIIASQGPLQTGISSLGRILFDRRYVLQPGKISTRRISFNLRHLINYRKDTHGLADRVLHYRYLPLLYR